MRPSTNTGCGLAVLLLTLLVAMAPLGGIERGGGTSCPRCDRQCPMRTKHPGCHEQRMRAPCHATRWASADCAHAPSILAAAHDFALLLPRITVTPAAPGVGALATEPVALTALALEPPADPPRPRLAV